MQALRAQKKVALFIMGLSMILLSIPVAISISREFGCGNPFITN
jgi:hypothetical protein